METEEKQKNKKEDRIILKETSKNRNVENTFNHIFIS